jgi:hypothetical protein
MTVALDTTALIVRHIHFPIGVRVHRLISEIRGR